MTVSAELIADLKQRYAEPQRHYHSWAHIEALLAHYRRWQGHFHRPLPVLWALYWHDAIYDPMAKDNEEQSAQLLERMADDILSAADLEFAAIIVRATARHEVPVGLTREDEADLSLFLDLDLSVLGAPAGVFDQYECDVRSEYIAVPDEAFRGGRKAILERFLARERLYFTDLAHKMWDAPARENLRRSIAALSV